MSIKTLLVHLATDDEAENRLNIACTMARELSAHLICLYVGHPVVMPAGIEGRGASMSFLREVKKDSVKKAKALEKKAMSLAKVNNIEHEWHYDEEDHLESLLAFVHHVDLTIVSQINLNHFEDRLMHNFIEHFIMRAGGPILSLPKGTKEFHLSQLENILVAWDYSTQSIRAVRDCKDILSRSKKIEIVIGTKKGKDKDLTPVINYLSRHNIKAEPLPAIKLSGHFGDELIDKAHEIKADAILMGAYQRTGFVDLIVGSTTRWVISHSDLPVLLSH